MRKIASRWVRLKGKLTKPIAHAAGDRRSEAKAELEETLGRKPDDTVVDLVQQDVRLQHHDIRRPRRRRRP